MSQSRNRKSNWDRVAELNSILGPVIKKTGYYFSLLRNLRECKHPYALCFKMSPEHSLDFKGMKAMAMRMRAAYDNGGDEKAIYDARFNY